MTTFTSREFSRGSGRARRATHYGPVFITDRGKPAYVLLGIDDYNRLAGVRTRIADLLFMPGGCGGGA